MGSRILVIEDNPTNMELMTYLLNAFADASGGVHNALRDCWEDSRCRR